MEHVVLSPTQKALQINLDPNIYGTYAEIGAGQEVVSHFFRAGGASQTIAKTMSAYDRDFSDAIYGKEDSGRYVCESRLKKMLSQEYGLIETRLDREEYPDTRYFTFAIQLPLSTLVKPLRAMDGWDVDSKLIRRRKQTKLLFIFN